MILLLAWASAHILPQLHGGLLLLLRSPFILFANILWHSISMCERMCIHFRKLIQLPELAQDATSYMKSLFKKIFSLPLEKLPATHFLSKCGSTLSLLPRVLCCFSMLLLLLIGLATLWHSPKKASA